MSTGGRKVRTEDETPLTSILSILSGPSFQNDLRYILAGLWIFLHFYLIERVDPNKERYWKKIIIEQAGWNRNISG